MFFLRVHSVDSEQPLDPESIFSENDEDSSPKFRERRGVLHLFRSSSHSSIPSPSSRSSLVFILAVPNYLSFDDLIRWCGPHLHHLHRLLFIRNDGMEDRYSVLIELQDQRAADAFYTNFNGKTFSPGERCAISCFWFLWSTQNVQILLGLLLMDVLKYQLVQFASRDWTRIEVEYSLHFAITPFNALVFQSGRTCLARYKEGHAIQHWKDTQHCYSLDFKTQQIWDYVGDSYVHRLNQNQSKVDGKFEGMNYRCILQNGDCDECECHDDLEIDGALYNSKVEAILEEYNRLLTSQLETQRQYYESLLAEAKSKVDSSVSEAVEKAVTSGLQDIQDKLEKCTEERNGVAEENKKLIQNQQLWRNKIKEAEEREAALVKFMNQKITDMEEQIRDVKIFVQAQKTIDKMTDSNGIKDGTVLPVAYEQSTPGNSKRNRKSGRRRN
nr:BRCA1-associated protein isoform X2 [Arachis hypogaea]